MKVLLLEVSFMKFILRISNEIKWKMKVFVTRSIIEELHSWYSQREQMEGESGVNRSIMDELHSSDLQGVQMEGESVVSQ